MDQVPSGKVLGDVVARHRKAQNRSARDVAREAGIDVATMTRLEKGLYRQPDPLTLKGVSRALSIPILELFQAAGYVTPHDIVDMTNYAFARGVLLDGEAENLRNEYIARLIEEREDFSAETYDNSID
jgi:transcriptional regulator with XRE-family HTH domain